MNKTINIVIFTATIVGLSGGIGATENLNHLSGDTCSGFGPQTPRDIDNVVGENTQLFSLAPSSKKMNLCNIHFHNNAEHKAKAFSIYAGAGEHGYGGGYQCKISQSLSKRELSQPKKSACKGLISGDTIEVHWVHTSCDIEPGKGLGSCLSETCANPDLRVETQVFTLVNDSSAINFSELSYDGVKVNNFHQVKSLPTNTGTPVEFLGSTTGPKYNAQQCSPMQVTWSVRPECAKLDINTLGSWCEGNIFEEDHAHGVRELVVDPKLLSKIN